MEEPHSHQICPQIPNNKTECFHYLTPLGTTLLHCNYHYVPRILGESIRQSQEVNYTNKFQEIIYANLRNIKLS